MTGEEEGTRVAGIDALRGVAVALVLLRHALPDAFPGAGVVGVVMFFALSGHLITGVLLEAPEGRLGTALASFYRRRVARLVPALVVLLVALTAVTLVADPLGDRDELRRTLLVAATWTGDLPFRHGSAATFHLWTLAVEEQFYLLWPAVLLLAAARRRVGTALAVVATGCLVACVATVVRLADDPDLAYPLPSSWAVCFVIGAASRVYAARLATPPRGLAVLAVTTLLALSVVPLRGHALTYLVGGPVIAGLTAVLVLRARRRHDRGRAAPSARRAVRGPVPAVVGALAALGTVSYAAYLWGYPLTLWLRAADLPAAGPIALLATLLAATASWHLVERPVQARVRRRAELSHRAGAGRPVLEAVDR